jgi:hypothetical protein
VNTLIEKRKAQWRASEAKANRTYPCGNGLAYESTPQQRAAATQAFSRMVRAYEAAGISEPEMIRDLCGVELKFKG